MPYTIEIDDGKPIEIIVDNYGELLNKVRKIMKRWATNPEEYAYTDITIYNNNEEDITDYIVNKIKYEEEERNRLEEDEDDDNEGRTIHPRPLGNRTPIKQQRKNNYRHYY